jgi:hypothetical protein
MEIPDIRELIEKSSLGAPNAKRLRAKGRRILRGEPEPTTPFERRAKTIHAQFMHGDFDEKEAFERLIEAGCGPKRANREIRSWLVEADPNG